MASGEQNPGLASLGQSTGCLRKPGQTCHSAWRSVRRRVRLVWELAEQAGGPEGAVTSALIRSEGGPAVPVLDAAGLLRRNFRRRRSPQPSTPTAGLPASPRAEAARAEEGRVLVSVFSNRQEYALPIEAVEEIVPLPQRFSAVPGADGRVVGVVDLRHQLLPLVSLRALLGWPEEQDPRRQVAVVRLDGAILLGLVVDRAGEILRLPASSLHPLPPLLMRGGKLEIGAICRMEEGRRLVSVLSPENLVRHDAVREAVAAGGTRDGAEGGDEETEMDGRDADAEARETEEFVVFRLAGEEYGVPIAEVDEVVRLDGLTRVPKAPDFLEGIMNLRGAVLPVLDQRRRFALPPQARTGRERVMVHTVGGLRAGFIVDSIAQVLRVPGAAVGAVPELSQTEVPLVARVVNLPEAGRLLPVLDTARLLDRDEMGELADLAASG